MKLASLRPRGFWEWFGLVFAVWGIPGTIDAGDTWATWLESMSVYTETAPFAILLGVIIVLWSRFRLWHRFRKWLNALGKALCRPATSRDTLPLMIDLTERIDAIEAAIRCADESDVNLPRAKAWLERLTASQTFLLDPIDAATTLTVDQWLTIVHNICHSHGDPLPLFFQRAFDSTPTDSGATITNMEAFRSAPGSGILAIKLIRAARTVEEADRLFEMHRHADTRTDIVQVYSTYGEALSRHGEQVRADEIWHKAGFMEAGGKED